MAESAAMEGSCGGDRLARLVMLHAADNAPARELTAATLARLDLPFEAIYSTFGRIIVRSIESKLMVDRMAGCMIG